MTIENPTVASARGERGVLTLWDRNDRLGLELDAGTGLLTALLQDGGRRRLPVRLSATLVTEGDEVERHPFGLAYANTRDLSAFRLVSPDVARVLDGSDELIAVRTAVDGWRVDWRYRLRASTPRLEIQAELWHDSRRSTRTLRNFLVQVDVAPDTLDGWRVEAPGSDMRGGIPVVDLIEPVSFSEPAFSGSGMLVLHRPDERAALLVWPFSRTEQARNTVQSIEGAARVAVETGLAGRVSGDERLLYTGIELDAFDATWDELRPTISHWLGTLGVSSPADTAGWIPGCTIFEVQIGTSVFWNGFAYSPYPTMRDLYDDLGRIAGLGFDCIQIMPRQPFPSYNIFDLADITTSYGDEDDLRMLVEACHALGMRVILDVLMHGVIDAEIIHRAADRVRSGPYFARLDEGTEIVPDEAFTAYQGQDYLVAWSRHILDFEEHWAGGSPGEHPLVAEHPEWFIRTSDGEIIGVYTKALDAANLGWQEYFTASALDLVRRLDVDGFRFDAPSYNEVPNWSPATQARASASQLGSVGHFARLRPELKALKPDAMLYTEPAGSVFRQTMDITYNYDEHWLIHAVLRPRQALERNPLGIRHARDLATWLRDKEAALPIGAMTARHIDSHDTFWWPLPGFKWRREQYGIPATRALLATFSLIGGVYMTFVGGEIGVEDDIRRMARLRAAVPELRLGRVDYDAIRADDDRIFAVARELDGAVSLVLVNLSSAAVVTTVRLDPASIRSTSRPVVVHDAWNDTTLATAAGYAWTRDELASFPMEFGPYQARVLTIRPTATHS